MASLAEIGRKLLIKRAQAGVGNAKGAGCVGERKPKMTPSKLKAAPQLLDVDVPRKDIAANLGVWMHTLYFIVGSAV